MQKILLACLFAGLAAPTLLGAAGDARNADVPVISTLLEQRDGTSIKLSFLAVHWDAETMAALQTSKEMRDYFNAYLAPKMGILETNVKLRFGPMMQIDTGVFYIGLKVNEPAAADQPMIWSLVISDDKAIRVTLPLNIVLGKTPREHLSFFFTPGITDRDFLFNLAYGDLSASARWTMIGIPSKTTDSPTGNPSVWNLTQTGVNPAAQPEEIHPATSQIEAATPDILNPTPKINLLRAKKVGSGSLRYLDDLQKKEKNTPSSQTSKKEEK